ARGPKKHLKRLNAPHHWMLAKLGGIWAPRPSTGPHKLRECLPVVLILRDRLKYALNSAEVLSICMRRHVKVDGKVRTDPKFPCGLMDVVTLEKSGDAFRLLYDTKGRFVLNPIDKAEQKFKLCKVMAVRTVAGQVPTLTTHDGRTIRYPDPIIKVNDSIKLNVETGKIEEVFKFDIGQLVMITSGRNAGRVGVLQSREVHPGSFDIIYVKDSNGAVFATRLSAAFIIGNENRPAIKLAKGRGLKLSIIEEKAQKERRAAHNRRQQK
ncbi:40S ribosomal protein S4, partial [Durusdinium trenchii]